MRPGRPLATICAAACAGALAAACGEPTPVVTVTRVELPGTTCDPPAGAIQLYATALGDFVPVARSGGADVALELEGVPPATRELVISVLGLGADDVVGRTGTLDADRLAAGGDLPIVLVPLRTACGATPLAAALVDPLIAPSGDGVLVVAREDGAAAWFDRARATWVAAAAPELDLVGASLAPLADGRALLTGAGRWQAFDAETLAFSPPADVPRLHAGTHLVPLADGTVLVAGGCLTGAPPCQGTADALLFDPRDDTFAPAFGLARPRAGGRAAGVGERAWLVGGLDGTGATATDVEVWGAEGSRVYPFAAEAVAGLASGGAVVASQTLGGVATVSALGVVGPVDATDPAARALLSLDDGRVLAYGGDSATILGGDGADAFDLDGTALAGVGLARLRDGVVVAVGGRDADGARDLTTLLRTSLAGPWDALAPEVFATGAATALVGSDLRLVTRTSDALVLSADGEDAPLASWVVGGAPIFGDVEVEASLRARDGAGAVVLLGWVGPERHVEVRLAPGAVPVIARARAGALIELCTGGTPLPSDRLAASTRVRVRAAAGRIDAFLDDQPLLGCEAVAGPGRAGVGTIGATGALELLTIEGRRR